MSNNYWENDLKGRYVLPKSISMKENYDFVMDGAVGINESKYLETKPDKEINNFDFRSLDEK
jgi:hypothetical protein